MQADKVRVTNPELSYVFVGNAREEEEDCPGCCNVLSTTALGVMSGGNSLLVGSKPRRSSPFPVALLCLPVLGCVAFTLHWLRSSAVQARYPKNFCEGHVQVVIAVHSAPERYRNREAVRKTVGHKAVAKVLPWRVLFYSGYTRETHRLHGEPSLRDTLVAPYEGVAENMVPIFLHMAGWVADKCGPWLRYLVHINDTTFVDVIALHAYIGRLPSDDKDFHCQVENMVQVDRNPENRERYVPETLFRDSVFPSHCYGTTFVVPGRYLRPLVSASRSIPPYPLFGPYITGHLPVLARIGHTDIRDRIGVSNDAHSWKRRWLFAPGFSTLSEWKRRWLQMLVCYEDDENATSALTLSIVRRIQLRVLD